MYKDETNTEIWYYTMLQDETDTEICYHPMCNNMKRTLRLATIQCNKMKPTLRLVTIQCNKMKPTLTFPTTQCNMMKPILRFATLECNKNETDYNVPVCSGTQKEQHQDSFFNMAVFLFKLCYPKRYCACLISMCFCGTLHHTCITCHNIHHISPFTTYCFS